MPVKKKVAIDDSRAKDIRIAKALAAAERARRATRGGHMKPPIVLYVPPKRATLTALTPARRTESTACSIL